VRRLISELRRDLVDGKEISEVAKYLYRENSLGEASKRSASPTNARTLVYAVTHKFVLLKS
jgi:hypothetical protein